jgi:hypothetical protein
MKLSRRDFYILAGLGLIVGAFFAAAEAIGSLIALVYFLASTDYSGYDRSVIDDMVNTWRAGKMSDMVHGVGSFLILILSGKWMLRGPKLLDRWIEGDRKQDEADSPQEITKANKPCEATGDNAAS